MSIQRLQERDRNRIKERQQDVVLRGWGGWVLVVMMIASTAVIAGQKSFLSFPLKLNAERLKEEEYANQISATALSHHGRPWRALQGSEQDSSKPWKYSEYATIVPDPEYTAPNDNKQALKDAGWKPWHFWDDQEDDRPAVQDCTAYPPSCDVPSEDWDDMSWQVDAVFVNHILDAGQDMISQVLEAIYMEYGYQRSSELDMMQVVQRNQMFHWEKVARGSSEQPKTSSLLQGGWTTERSMAGLARRLLHAVMINDEFVVAVVGDQAAAGAGNHFRQSYAMQMHRVVAPVLARLGVKLTTLNLSSRFGGSVAAGLGKVWGATRGIDLMIWDEGHTERSRPEKDLFLRQVLTQSRSTGKVPVVWMGGVESDWELLQLYHDQADVDIGRFGNALSGVPLTTSFDTAAELPHAAQYLHCDAQHLGVCRQAPDEYCAKCWLDRPDIANPTTLFPNMTDKVPHQYEWNPGWRQHQLIGRVLANAILNAAQDALQTFTNGAMGGPPLDPDDWHMAAYYQNIHDKLAALDATSSGCTAWQGILPIRVCTVPLQGATQTTPRAGPSIANLIKPAAGAAGLTNPEKVLYDGYDVHNTCFDNPDAAVPNIVGLVSARRRALLQKDNGNDEVLYEEESLEQDMPIAFAHIHQSRRIQQQQQQEEAQRLRLQQEQPARSLLETGAGWRIVDELPGQCDGQYTSICGRQASNTCPLLGHHDSLGQVQGNEAAGWLVLELPNFQHGLLMAGLRLTRGNVSAQRQRRQLGGTRSDDAVAKLPESFVLDVSIDGKLMSWNKQEFLQHFRPQVQRGLDVIILMDEEQYTPSNSETVEVGLRIRDCSGDCSLGLTHVFWA